MVQLAIADPALREGQVDEGFFSNRRISRLVQGANGMSFGRLCQWGTDPAKQVQEPAAVPIADVDAIGTAAIFTSAATAQSISATTFDGAIGRDRISPCRCLTITFDAHANWDTPSGGCRVDAYFLNADGSKGVDRIFKPNGSGAGTYNFAIPASMCLRIDIEACNGVGGTATVGVATIGATTPVDLSPDDYPGVSTYRPLTEPATAARELAEYDDVSVLTDGVVVVVVEHAVSVGDQAYVRMVAAGADLAGQFTGQDGADTPATYARYHNATFITAAAADGLAKLKLGGS